MPSTSPAPRAAALALALLLVLAGVPGALAAQASARAAAGEVFGTIVDAESALPLPGASVTLEPRGPGEPRTARTDAEGRYRFAAVAEGAYTLRVQRLGYRPGSVEVALRGAARPSVSLGLLVQPVALQPLEARGAAPAPSANPFGGRARTDAAGEERLELERLRQRAHLAPDVRLVTRADVDQALPLAETDLFRALQRLPGVGARDEYSAELWTRGGAWDHTRVYFDGLPLFNPVHTSGLFSAPNADAVGSVLLHPGAQPLATGGGAAAALEVRSRRGGEDGPLAGTAELSLTSLRVALDGSSGRHAWMVAGRRGHTDWLAQRVEARSRDQEVWVTTRFEDAAARYDLRLGRHAALEASAVWQRDVLRDGPDSDWLGRALPRWGSLAARATLRAPLGSLEARVGVGASRFDARVSGDEEARPRQESLFSWPTLFAARSAVRHVVAEGSVQPRDAGARAPRWAAGGGVVGQQVRYHGPPVFPLDLAIPPTADRRSGELAYAFAWAERRWQPARTVSLEAGARVEAGGGVRWGPRAAARWQPRPALSVSAAAGRSWQTVQAGPELQQQAMTQHLWLLAGDGGVPALRSDVATLGAEAWLARGWLFSLSGYARRSDGVAVRHPQPGEVVGRPGFVSGGLDAHGAEASLRRLVGRWTASASYSWGRARARAGGITFPAETDQRHALDLAARVDAGAGLRLGAAFTAAGGGAFTRFFGGIASCNPEQRCEWAELPRAGEPGGLRAPAYASLDLSAEWERSIGPVRLGAFFQLHNALDRRNPARYHRSIHYPRCGYGEPDPTGGCTEDVWGRGLARLPVLGLRAAF